MDEQTKQRIDEYVKKNKIFLFMKGTPASPMCGFSFKAVEILKDQGVKFEAFDVLSDEAIRQGIKEYADWPTIPQLYIDGEFVGGCDILTEMAASGELAKVLGK